MPDLFALIRKWRKPIIAVVLISTITVAVITFLKPRKYLSVATAVAGSSYAADKSKIFNANIESLYPALGSPDDLNLVLGTAQLDTLYLFVTDQFNLYDHYKISTAGNAARNKAASLLKRNTKVIKSEYGELKVKVWDTDKYLAPQLANAILSRLEFIHSELQSAGNRSALNAIDSSLKKFDTTRIPESLNQEYQKVKREYQVMTNYQPPVLIVVEKARPSEYPDQPKIILIIIATLALSILFSLLLVLVIEKSKTKKNDPGN